ncbi:YoaK family protein [Microbacterium sp. NPDC076895]|uniref:YoaK family protein n=1 Tax=Microbacterium sp. NPDC076895 TaxID=3154957 RepID=UPI00343C96D0
MVDSLPRSRLAIAVLLAVLAGYIDGIAFIYLGGYFVSFMSGNTTQSGVELAGGDLAAAGFGFAVIVAFVVGVMAGTAIRSPRRDRGWLVLLGVAVLIAVGAALASAPPVDANAVTGAALVAVAPTAVCLSLAMGAVNTVFSGSGGPSFGITYMTGALVKIGEGIAGALRGGDRTGWLRYLALWLAIAVGAIGGATVYAAFGTAALWYAAVFALAITWVDLTARARASRGSTPA